MEKQSNWDSWSQGKVNSFQQEFLAWYQENKRLLPWRVNKNPYRIWISEIMLQQTRVDTVIDYFYRFMEEFPTIEDLAKAPEDKLLKAWEGLGYYSRARNLQAAAKQIVTEFGGKMPASIEEIRSLKGIGPYTAGAIASIAFDLPEPAIDGNVMRVVSRLFCIEDDISKAGTRKVFEAAMGKIISQKQPGDFNQALMDLGSAICLPKNPQCESCPISSYCLAYSNRLQENFPVKSQKIKQKDVYYVAGIIENETEEYLIEQRPETGLLANMWLFPMQEVSKEEFAELKARWQAEDSQQLSLDLVAEEEAPAIFANLPVVWQKRHYTEVTHVYSHLKWHVLPFYGRKVDQILLSDKAQWVGIDDFSNFVFPKVQYKLIESWQGGL